MVTFCSPCLQKVPFLYVLEQWKSLDIAHPGGEIETIGLYGIAFNIVDFHDAA